LSTVAKLGLPASIVPIGRPSLNPQGTDIAGCGAMSNAAVFEQQESGLAPTDRFFVCWRHHTT
jgi:hypothetical protein